MTRVEGLVFPFFFLFAAYTNNGCGQCRRSCSWKLASNLMVKRGLQNQTLIKGLMLMLRPVDHILAGSIHGGLQLGEAKGQVMALQEPMSQRH